MYIEIEQNIIQQAVDKQRYVAVLTELALCASKGKHIVVVPCLKRNNEFINGLRGVLKPAELKFLSYNSIRGAKSVKTIFKNINIYAVVTNNKEGIVEKAGKYIIYVNIDNNGEFNFSDETRIIVENKDDSDFYNYVCKFYKREQEQTLEKCVNSFFLFVAVAQRQKIH